MPHEPARSAPRDRLLPVTRWLAAFLLPFLAVAFILLYVWPDRTDRLFAWTIHPPLTAMLLAAAYLGGLLYFGEVLRAAHWIQVKNGFPAILTFATLLGLATALHWDRFHPGHVSFIAWAGLYFSTPFLILGVWLVNARAAGGDGPAPDDRRLPPAWRWVLLAVGLATLGVAVALWTRPTVIIPLWPWTLTPLTAKVVGALFSLPGLVGLATARDGRWEAARLVVQAQTLSTAAILIGVLRDQGALDWSRLAAWGFVGGLGLNFVLYAVLLLVMVTSRRAGTPGVASGSD